MYRRLTTALAITSSVLALAAAPALVRAEAPDSGTDQAQSQQQMHGMHGMHGMMHPEGAEGAGGMHDCPMARGSQEGSSSDESSAMEDGGHADHH